MDAAVDVLRVAVGFGHPNWSAAGGVALGVALARRGDVVAAEAAYRTVIGTGHPDFAPMAWFDLGTLHQSQADFAAAEAYRAAVESGIPSRRPKP